MRIRLYDPRDLDPTVEVWFMSWTTAFPSLSPPWPYDGWRTRFEHKLAEGAVVFVAEESAQVFGFVLLFENIGRLDQIFVRPGAQSRGIGTSLLALAKQRCPLGLHLDTQQTNTGARRFYERPGFRSGREGVNAVNGQPNIEYVWTPTASKAVVD